MNGLKPGGADALLFDLGGVIIDIDFNRVFARWAASADHDVVSLRERYSHDEPYRRHEVGAISAEQYFDALRGTLGIDIPHADFLAGWNDIFIRDIPGIADLLARIAPKIPCYAFSNSNLAHEIEWSRRFADVLSHFRKVFVSSTIKLRKPDAAAFQHVAQDIGVAPERIVFFDDSAENVTGACACGLQAVHVRSHADVVSAVTALGL